MLAMDFLRNPEKTPPRSVYAVFGEDGYLRRQTISALIATALGPDADEFCVSHFPGETIALSAVMDELRTLPFLASKRVVIIETADTFVTAHRRELELYADRPAGSGVLILSVKSWPGNTKIAKIVEKNGLAIDCKSPGERDLARWLVATARGQGVTLDEEASQLLVELAGTETGILANEIDKLVTYVGHRKSVTREDVTTMVDAGKTQEIWTAIDCAAAGQAEQALGILDRMLETKESEYRIMGGITFSLLKTYRAGRLRTLGVEAREACREAGVFPRDVEKTLKHHTHLGPRRVSQLADRLLRTDLEIKGASTLAPQVVLETLFVELSARRKD